MLNQRTNDVRWIVPHGLVERGNRGEGVCRVESEEIGNGETSLQ